MKALKLGALLAAAALALAAFTAPGFAQTSAQVGNNLAVNPLLSSAARTATTVTTADQTNTSWTKAQIIINVSSWTSGNYTPSVQGKDPLSGNYYTILTGAAISSLPSAPVVLHVGPGFPNTSNVSQGTILPRTWRVSFAGASTPSMTFSASAFLAP